MLALCALLLVVSACERADRGPSTAQPDSLLTDISRPVDHGRVVLVQLATGPEGYAFEPAEVRIHAGDVVRFVMTRSLPESVAFDTVGAAPEATDFVVQRGLLRGPLLTTAGQVYDASFRDAPPGRYPFVSLPHASRGMRGVVVVEPAG